MYRKRKYLIFGIITVLVVGFSAISTTLILSGKTLISVNESDFKIYFSKSAINAKDVTSNTISKDGHALIFDTSLNDVNEVTELDYEVTNDSQNYDAKVEIVCSLENTTNTDKIINIEDYLDITYENVNQIIPAKSKDVGKIIMKQKKMIEDDTELSLNCKMDFNAAEREELGVDLPEIYSFSGYLYNDEDELLPNTVVVILEQENKYFVSDNNARIILENFNEGLHDIYVIVGLSIDEIKEMSDDQIKENSVGKGEFDQSSKRINFDNGYYILDELKKKEYTVTFDAQGGKVTPETKKVLNHEKYGELPTPTLEGYNFLGWFTDTEYTDEIKADTKVDLNKNITLYAKWEGKNITVNFDSNGGSEENPIEVRYNSNYGELPIPNKKGMSFDGWYLDDTLVTSTTKMASLLPVTLVAKWSTNYKNILVDNDGVVESIKIDLSKPIINSLPEVKKTGYTFEYWRKDDGTKLNDDEYLEENEDMHLYANFKANKYTITFNANTGIVNTPTKEVTYNQTYGDLPTPTKDGYNFIGWFTDENSGNQITQDTIVKITNNETLYAHYILKADAVYTVKHWQQNIGVSDDENATNYTLIYTESLKGEKDELVTPDTKSYEGFTCPDKQSIKVLEDGSSEVNYYYKRNTYNITINKDAGVESINQKDSYYYGESINIDYVIKDGYTFKSITGDMTTNEFTMPAQNLVININTTEDNYTISYILNGGTLTSENPSTYTVTSKNFTLNNPTKTGYTFTGWTGSDETKKDTNLTVPTGSTGNKIFVATYDPNKYTVSFDSNGGNPVNTVLTVTYDGIYGTTLPTPTRTDYSFAGWYTSASGGTKIISLTKVSITSDTTLYAHWSDKYTDPILHGADPVIKGRLVPVKLSKLGVVTYADANKEWYNYENKEWANAVILTISPSKEYQVGDIIKEDDIESYFVWIPRYRYQIFDEGKYTASSVIDGTPPEDGSKEIQIVFESNDTVPSTGSTKGSWLTHPAFTNFDVNGMWVGKFETGYKGALTKIGAEVDENDPFKVVIKPNVHSWRDITVSNIFKTSYDYRRTLDSHMMKNTEWGAAAYLSHSKYGINTEVRINNNKLSKTGYAGTEKDAFMGSLPTETVLYNTTTGHLASTTGNITGIYDMNGGSYEYVAGYRSSSNDKSGFTSAEFKTYAKYLDVYPSNTTNTSWNYRKLGDATGEMGPFYNMPVSGNNYYHNNWYTDFSHMVDSTWPWFTRGGDYIGGNAITGQFDFGTDNGRTHKSTSFRIVLTPTD